MGNYIVSKKQLDAEARRDRRSDATWRARGREIDRNRAKRAADAKRDADKRAKAKANERAKAQAEKKRYEDDVYRRAVAMVGGQPRPCDLRKIKEADKYAAFLKEEKRIADAKERAAAAAAKRKEMWDGVVTWFKEPW